MSYKCLECREVLEYASDLEAHWNTPKHRTPEWWRGYRYAVAENDAIRDEEPPATILLEDGGMVYPAPVEVGPTE